MNIDYSTLMNLIRQYGYECRVYGSTKGTEGKVMESFDNICKYIVENA